MAQFKNKTNGVILTTENKTVIEQLKKNPDYAPYKKPGKKNPDDKQEQPEAGAEEGSEEGEGAAE